MNLEAMKAIAAPLGRELPELAGGAPTWPIYIGPQTLELESVVAKTPKTTTVTQNLFATNQPTIMERWELLSLWVPSFVSVGLGKEATQTEISESRILLTLNIRYGGDIIWSGGFRPVLEGAVGFGALGTIIASENFINPLPIERGRGLVLESVANVTWPAIASIQIFLAQIATGATGATRKPQEGTIQYMIQVLTGHRVL